jgi:hypothetical protein
MAGDGDAAGAGALTSGGRGGATAGCGVYGVGPACCGAVEWVCAVGCCGMVAVPLTAPAAAPGAAAAAAGFSHTASAVVALQ